MRACRLETDLKVLGIKALSVVSGEMAVAFCREYHLDLVLLDLRVGDARDAVRLLKGREMTSSIPIVGISASVETEGAERAALNDLCGVLDGSLPRVELAQTLQQWLPNNENLVERLGEQGERELYLNSVQESHKEPLVVMLGLSERILVLAGKLKIWADQFGEDGPEMFDYVEKSSQQMHRRLCEIACHDLEGRERQLRDREVRHDFRNILASVRGFTDLILMEDGIPERALTGLREICACSNEFVEWLDVEKAAAVGV